MASFDKYAHRLKKWEGNRYIDDPNDYGGATNSGVTLATFRDVFGQDKTKEDLKNMTDEQWRTVMKGIWDKCGGDSIKNQSVAEIYVDWCINSGVSKIKMVQQMVGTPADGIVGPKTIRAINAANQEALHRSIKIRRAQRFIDQINANGRQMAFFNGWFNRLIDFNYSK